MLGHNTCTINIPVSPLQPAIHSGESSEELSRRERVRRVYPAAEN